MLYNIGLLSAVQQSKPAINIRTLLVFSRSIVSDFFATPWTAACQAPLSMGFPRQEYGSGLPFPPPGDLPDPGIKAASPASLLLCRQILYRTYIQMCFLKGASVHRYSLLSFFFLSLHPHSTKYISGD